MTNTRITIILTACIAFFNISPAFTQKKAEIVTTRWVSQPLIADGSLSDWPDSLSLYNEATKLYYSIANDDQNVYLALSTSREDVTRVLAGGISFAANIEGKKKDAPTVIFPVLDRTPGKPRNLKEQPEREEMQQQVLSRIKDIKVAGFKEIIDGGISLENMYGIRAAASFDSNNNLIQEIVIPLSLLNLSTASPAEVTYSIRVNGLQSASTGMAQRQGYPRQPMGGMYGNQFPPRNSPMNKLLSATEFFIRSRLAAKPN